MSQLKVSVSLDGAPILLAALEQLSPERLGLEQWVVGYDDPLVAWMQTGDEFVGQAHWRPPNWTPADPENWRRLYVGPA